MANFETSLKKLETIVEQLEQGDLALEQSLKLFEEGKVQMLVKQRDGSHKLEAFPIES